MEITTKNVGRRTSLKEFEKDLLEDGLLRLRPFFKRDIKGVKIEEFIKRFFKTYNNDLITAFADNGNEQTRAGARRSGGDIFRICKYYYPKTTLEEVMKTIDKLHQEGLGDNKYLKSQVCRQVNKRVYNTDSRTTVFHKEEKDEFNRLVGDYIKENG